VNEDTLPQTPPPSQSPGTPEGGDEDSDSGDDITITPGWYFLAGCP